ncbi:MULTISPECIES: hypothetical protein [unclassified Rhodococcus (in: high G+C Gram-positive bacteria)]|nr:MULTISPECIES: hypothetical protein [unclassified Rhodococcus (in: high G+C Gram-positive bacteria)]
MSAALGLLLFLFPLVTSILQNPKEWKSSRDPVALVLGAVLVSPVCSV